MFFTEAPLFDSVMADLGEVESCCFAEWRAARAGPLGQSLRDQVGLRVLPGVRPVWYVESAVGWTIKWTVSENGGGESFPD
jgi:hypothetical protein